MLIIDQRRQKEEHVGVITAHKYLGWTQTDFSQQQLKNLVCLVRFSGSFLMFHDEAAPQSQFVSDAIKKEK